MNRLPGYASEQERRHHGGVIRRIALLVGIGAKDGGQIELLGDQIPNEVGEMSLGHEVPHRGRQQHHLVEVPVAGVLAMLPLQQSRSGKHFPTQKPIISVTYEKILQRYYLDGLLDLP